MTVDTERLSRVAGASVFGVPDQEDRDLIREAAREISRLRAVAAWYADEPCEYVEGESTCNDVDVEFPEEYCGSCLARAALREH